MSFYLVIVISGFKKFLLLVLIFHLTLLHFILFLLFSSSNYTEKTGYTLASALTVFVSLTSMVATSVKVINKKNPNTKGSAHRLYSPAIASSKSMPYALPVLVRTPLLLRKIIASCVFRVLKKAGSSDKFSLWQT